MTGWTYGQGWVSMALGYRLFFRKFCSRSKQRVISFAGRIFFFFFFALYEQITILYEL